MRGWPIAGEQFRRERGRVMRKYQIAVIGGDGVGPEVVAEGVKVLKTVASLDPALHFHFTEYPWGCEYYLRSGQMMPPDALEILAGYDAIYLGAVGYPTVPDHISLWGLLLPIRKGFEQYVNLRPIRLLTGAPGPLKGKGPEDINFIVVRENTEGEYAAVGGITGEGTPEETVTQSGVFTRNGVTRIMHYAFALARRRDRQLTVVTKSNALNYSMVYWDKIAKEIAAEYPEVETRFIHVDAMAMFLVRKPELFDVVVASNLFGDILTDLGAAIQGGMGYAAGANLNPERRYPSMFEPIHGSAPDIARQGRANPIAAVWAVKMLLDHLGETGWAELLMRSIEDIVKRGKFRTPDAGGRNTTSEVGDAICASLRENAVRDESSPT